MSDRTRTGRRRILGGGLALVTAVGLSTTALLSGSSAAPANLVSNGGLEDGTSGWITWGDGARLVAGTGGHSGSGHGELTATRRGHVAVHDTPNAVVSTRAGEAFVLSAWVRSPDTDRLEGILRTREVKDGQETLLSKPFTATREWSRVTLNSTTRTTGGFLDVRLVVEDLPVGPRLSFDDVSLVRTTAPTGTPTAQPTATPTATPTTSPSTPPRTGVRLGVYNGNAQERADENTRASFGAWPEVANTYVQPEGKLNLAYEIARVKRGTSPNITVTTKGTQLLAQMVRGEPAALAWLDRYVAQLKQVAAANPSVPVYATMQHEFVASINQGSVTGTSADPVNYGRALSILYRKIDATGMANLKATYWIVGYNRQIEGAVGQALTADFDAMLFDPYARTADGTLASTASGDLAWIRSQPWYKGQPIGLAEFGMAVRNGDAALARYYTDVRGQLKDLGISFAVLFNRSRDHNHKITTGEFPRAVAAFGASLRN